MPGCCLQLPRRCLLRLPRCAPVRASVGCAQEVYGVDGAWWRRRSCLWGLSKVSLQWLQEGGSEGVHEIRTWQLGDRYIGISTCHPGVSQRAFQATGYFVLAPRPARGGALNASASWRRRVGCPGGSRQNKELRRCPLDERELS